MLIALLLIYLSIIVGCQITTLILIILEKSWGEIPHRFLRFIDYIQSKFPVVYPSIGDEKYDCDKEDVYWPSVIKKTNRREKEEFGLHAVYDFSKDDPLEMGVRAIHAGLEAIVQDDLSFAFDHASSYNETLLRWKPLPSWNKLLKVVFYMGLIFRLCFLLPVRLGLFFFSFVFVTGCCIASYLTSLTEKQRTWLSVVYSRIFCAGLGVVAEYNESKGSARRPGLVVSNHISPNDVPILWAGANHNRTDGYIVTGQKHSGIIGFLETVSSRVCPSLWLERKSAESRQHFLKDVLEKAKTTGPILLFPEGYCTNNDSVLQFRKAAFEDGIDIYPVAFRQSGQFGDGYWYEDKFHMYLLRLMYSWATVYQVNFLEKVRRDKDETNEMFAKRVQRSIAASANVPALHSDGGVWYKKEEQQRQKAYQQLKCSERAWQWYTSLTHISTDSSDEDLYIVNKRYKDNRKAVLAR